MRRPVNPDRGFLKLDTRLMVRLTGLVALAVAPEGSSPAVVAEIIDRLGDRLCAATNAVVGNRSPKATVTWEMYREVLAASLRALVEELEAKT